MVLSNLGNNYKVNGDNRSSNEQSGYDQSNLKYLLFDWGDTLVPSEQLQRDCWLRALDTFSDIFPDYPKIIMQEFTRIYFKKQFPNDGAMFSEERILWMRDEMNHPASDGEIMALLKFYRTLYKTAIYHVLEEDKFGTFYALKQLKDKFQQGIRLGVISDNSIQTKMLLQKYLCAFGFEELFDFFIVSEEFGEIKPHPQMFIAGCNAAGILPNQAIYFGNNFSRDTGSLKIGMPFVFVSGYMHNNKEVNIDLEKFPEIRFITKVSIMGLLKQYY